MEVMMILGAYAFGLNTAAFTELNRNTQWRWPGQDVFLGIPALQFTGYGSDTITLPGVIFPEYWGGTGQLDQLRALADAGEPQTLIDGRGNVLGDYVITGVQERQSVFAAAGVARRQEFTVTLERYAMGEPPAARGISAIAAVASVSVATTGAAGIASSAGAIGAQGVTNLTAAIDSVQSVVSQAVTPLSGVLAAINRGIGVGRSLQSAATTAQQTIKGLGSINSLSSAQSALNNLVTVTGSAAQASTVASKVISDTVKAMEAAGDYAGAITTVRAAMIDVNRMAVGATRVRTQATEFIGGFA